ncbi:hypothetical protein DD549_00495 [Shewanella algae]|nr:hypothetical protein DD549_00495 [Shewanella algae]
MVGCGAKLHDFMPLAQRLISNIQDTLNTFRAARKPAAKCLRLSETLTFGGSCKIVLTRPACGRLKPVSAKITIEGMHLLQDFLLSQRLSTSPKSNAGTSAKFSCRIRDSTAFLRLCHRPSGGPV